MAQLSYNQKTIIHNVKDCPVCSTKMQDITDVKAYEGYGPRTYRWKQCTNKACGYREYYPIDQRGWPVR